jgi:hypothetical protein
MKNGNKVASHDVRLVLVAFVVGELAFIALIGQFRDTRLRCSVGSEADKLARRLIVERGTHWFQDALQNAAAGFPTRLSHNDSLSSYPRDR